MMKDMKKTMKKAQRTVNKINWNKTAQSATAIAGTLGGAMALARVISEEMPSRGKWRKISKAAKISAASLAVLAGGIKLFTDNMPAEARELKNQYRHYYKRYRKRLAF
ncbi:MAG: hypothetical protein ACM3S2_04225 [Ignavibacteriales bacterium]